MKFGAMKPADAVGGVTVHSIRQNGLVLKKGTLIGEAEVAALSKAGVGEVVVAKLEPGDISEDEAAASIAQAIGGEGVIVERAFTGRSNLFAAEAGVLVADREVVDRINRVDEAITLATLANFKPVVEGEMIATVKIVPFGMPAKLRDEAIGSVPRNALRVAPYRIKKVGIVSTLLPGLAPKVVEKTLHVTAERLAPAGAKIIAEKRISHDEKAVDRGDRRAVRQGRGARHRVRRLGHRRPARRHPGGDRAGRRQGRAFRHAGRSRQPDADRPGERRARAGRTGLRPLAEGKRV